MLTHLFLTRWHSVDLRESRWKISCLVQQEPVVRRGGQEVEGRRDTKRDRGTREGACRHPCQRRSSKTSPVSGRSESPNRTLALCASDAPLTEKGENFAQSEKNADKQIVFHSKSRTLRQLSRTGNPYRRAQVTLILLSVHGHTVLYVSAARRLYHAFTSGR